MDRINRIQCEIVKTVSQDPREYNFIELSAKMQEKDEQITIRELLDALSELVETNIVSQTGNMFSVKNPDYKPDNWEQRVTEWNKLLEKKDNIIKNLENEREKNLKESQQNLENLRSQINKLADENNFLRTSKDIVWKDLCTEKAKTKALSDELIITRLILFEADGKNTKLNDEVERLKTKNKL